MMTRGRGGVTIPPKIDDVIYEQPLIIIISHCQLQPSMGWLVQEQGFHQVSPSFLLNYCQTNQITINQRLIDNNFNSQLQLFVQCSTPPLATYRTSTSCTSHQQVGKNIEHHLSLEKTHKKTSSKSFAGFTFSIWSIIYLWLAASLLFFVVSIFISNPAGRSLPLPLPLPLPL